MHSCARLDPCCVRRARFQGTECKLKLEDVSSDGDIFYQVLVDGREEAVVHTAKGQKVLPVVSGLPSTAHEVEVGFRSSRALPPCPCPDRCFTRRQWSQLHICHSTAYTGCLPTGSDGFYRSSGGPKLTLAPQGLRASRWGPASCWRCALHHTACPHHRASAAP